MFLETSQNPQKNTCARVSFLIQLQASACNFIKKETLAQVFHCEFCKISKNTFSYRTPSVTASTFKLSISSKIESCLDCILLNRIDFFTRKIRIWRFKNLWIKPRTYSYSYFLTGFLLFLHLCIVRNSCLLIFSVIIGNYNQACPYLSVNDDINRTRYRD